MSLLFSRPASVDCRGGLDDLVDMSSPSFIDEACVMIYGAFLFYRSFVSTRHEVQSCQMPFFDGLFASSDVCRRRQFSRRTSAGRRTGQGDGMPLISVVPPVLWFFLCSNVSLFSLLRIEDTGHVNYCVHPIDLALADGETSRQP